MSDFAKFLLKAVVRKLLAILGTFLLTHGIFTQAESESFIATYLEEIVGSLLIGASYVWTYIYQRYVKDKVKTALLLPQGTSSEKLAEVLGEKE